MMRMNGCAWIDSYNLSKKWALAQLCYFLTLSLRLNVESDFLMSPNHQQQPRLDQLNREKIYRAQPFLFQLPKSH